MTPNRPADGPPAGAEPPRNERPAGMVRLAGGLVGVEAVATFAAGVGFAIAALVGSPSDEGTALLLGGLLAIYGAGVGLVARGVWRSRRWAGTPALLVQFFAVVVAWYQRSTLPVVATLVAAVAVVTGIVLLRLFARSTGEPPEG